MRRHCTAIHRSKRRGSTPSELFSRGQARDPVEATPRRWLAVAASLLAATLACSEPATEPSGDVSDPDFTLSEAGRYRLSVRPARPPIVLGSLHDWLVRVERVERVERVGGPTTRPPRVIFDGGMPTHGHGFVTAPRVTRVLPNGEYLVEGVKFHMAGPWQLRIAVVSAEGTDGASFSIDVQP